MLGGRVFLVLLCLCVICKDGGHESQRMAWRYMEEEEEIKRKESRGLNIIKVFYIHVQKHQNETFCFVSTHVNTDLLIFEIIILLDCFLLVFPPSKLLHIPPPCSFIINCCYVYIYTYVFLTITCSVYMMLLLCMLLVLTVWYWVTNQCAPPWAMTISPTDFLHCL